MPAHGVEPKSARKPCPPPPPASLCSYTGYVEQFDTLLGDLSVREMLLYTAELKRPREEALASKREAVDQLLAKLALDGCRWAGGPAGCAVLGAAARLAGWMCGMHACGCAGCREHSCTGGSAPPTSALH